MKFSAEKPDDILASCAGAYSLQTVSADLQVFIGSIQVRNRCWLPANPEAIAAFVDDQVEKHCLSTVKRQLCAIAFAHRMRDLPVPTETKVVRMAVRRAARRKPSRPKQVRGLTNAIRAQIVSRCPATLAGLRDSALISVGYDTLCRSSELAAMRVEQVTFDGVGIATVSNPALQIRCYRKGPGRLSLARNDTPVEAVAGGRGPSRGSTVSWSSPQSPITSPA